ELLDASQARRIAISQLKDSLNAIIRGCKQVHNTMELYKKTNLSNDDQFLNTMNKFYEESKKKCTNLEEKMSKLENRLEEIAELFGEEKKDLVTKPEDFFSLLDDFIESYKNEIRKMKQRKEQEERMKKKESKRLEKKIEEKPIEAPKINPAIKRVVNQPD